MGQEKGGNDTQFFYPLQLIKPQKLGMDHDRPDIAPVKTGLSAVPALQLPVDCFQLVHILLCRHITVAMGQKLHVFQLCL